MRDMDPSADELADKASESARSGFLRSIFGGAAGKANCAPSSRRRMATGCGGSCEAGRLGPVDMKPLLGFMVIGCDCGTVFLKWFSVMALLLLEPW